VSSVLYTWNNFFSALKIGSGFRGHLEVLPECFSMIKFRIYESKSRS
jgi:hypothetical protein